MVWILLLAITLLLILAIGITSREDENKFWIKIVALYLSGMVFLDIGVLKLPLGILIGLYLVNKNPGMNRKLKNLSLFFGLICFILTAVLPPISINDVLTYRELFNQINRFENVQTVLSLSPSSPEQAELIKLAPHAKGDMTLDDCIVIFRTWILHKENVSAKDFEWLWSQSYNDMKFKDSYYIVDDYTAEGYLDFEDGRKFFALFKKSEKNGKYFLALVVQYSAIKQGQERKTPF